MDNDGRMEGTWTNNLCLKDYYRHLWTYGSALHNRRLQVRFLSHPPFTTAEFIWMAATSRVACYSYHWAI